MYEVDELIIYGNTGVCKVQEITTLKGMGGVDKDKLYYILNPLFQDGTIYIPVDNTKIFMRPVITKEKAEELIDIIPTIDVEAYYSNKVQDLADHYENAISSHECEDLIELIMSIYAKKQYLEQQKRKFGQVDERFMKKAEELLYGEFSVALGIPKDEVRGYIAKRVGEMKEEVE